MLLSRGATILKSVNQFRNVKSAAINLKQVRNEWCYRTAPKPSPTWVALAEIAAGIAWWWVLWNFWHDFDHVVGHFEYPRPYEWSDKDLGIPPDNDDI